jgi:hypothetical protein
MTTRTRSTASSTTQRRRGETETFLPVGLQRQDSLGDPAREHLLVLLRKDHWQAGDHPADEPPGAVLELLDPTACALLAHERAFCV